MMFEIFYRKHGEVEQRLGSYGTREEAEARIAHENGGVLPKAQAETTGSLGSWGFADVKTINKYSIGDMTFTVVQHRG